MSLLNGPSASLAKYQLVVGCRAGGGQDVEARFRVLEQQRGGDHTYFVEARGHCLRPGSDLDRKTEKEKETEQYLRELTARGLQFQQSIAFQKANCEQAIKSAQGEGFRLAAEHMELKITEVVVGTTDALNKLRQNVMRIFVVGCGVQNEGKKIIEQTFTDASHAMNSMKVRALLRQLRAP